MKRYHLFVYEPTSYTNEFTSVYKVLIGSSAREKKIVSQARKLMAKEPTWFYFTLYDNNAFQFLDKLTNSNYERVGVIDANQMLNFIKLQVDNPNTPIV